MNRYNRNLFAFLIGNMKEMETELRAQSIVFDALATHVIAVDGIGDALALARESREMQAFVEHKYRMVVPMGARPAGAIGQTRTVQGRKPHLLVH